MEGLKLIPYIALIIAISGIILGATVIVQSEMRESFTQCWNSTYTFNATQNKCWVSNATGGDSSGAGTGNTEVGNFSYEYYALQQSIDGSNTVAGQIPTLAIIAVMVIIISVIAGVFVYMKYFS